MKFLLLIYNVCFPFALLALLPGSLRRMMRRGNYAHKFGQRFAFYSQRTRVVLHREQGRWIWIHAVSVGEVLIALKFIRALQAEQDVPVLLSTTTTTAFALAAQKRNYRLEVIYHPVDFFLTAKRAMKLIRPAALVLVEAEVWPNLTSEARRMKTPVILINARLSARSEKRYQALRFLAAPLFRSLDAICLQGPEDVPRFESIGALPEQLQITGSIKFDLQDSVDVETGACREIVKHLGWDATDPILLGASTHAGEELILARIYKHLRISISNLHLILVPRHFERTAKVLTELSSLSLSVQRRSLSPRQPAEVLIVDTTGELRQWTQLATLVFVGKSLTAKGGQNPAEAIEADKPLVFGPNMQNFAALVEIVLSHDGAKQVANEQELEKNCLNLLANPDVAQAMTARAREALLIHHGATRRTLEVLRSLTKTA